MRPLKGCLLDTHVLLWTLADVSWLSPRFRKMVSSETPVFYSSVSVLELTIKATARKLPPKNALVEELENLGFRELPFNAASASAVARFPGLVRHDPFDRMLVAQATHHDLYLETADSTLLELQLPDIRDARA